MKIMPSENVRITVDTKYTVSFYARLTSIHSSFETYLPTSGVINI